MNFNFIPYNLNADLSDFKGDIQYISSDNGVDLYRAKETLKKPLLFIPVTDVNLYFFEGNLITVYTHLAAHTKSLEQVKGILEKAIKGQGRILETDIGKGYSWKGQNELLALINSQKKVQLSLYFTVPKFSVFR